MTSTKVAKLFAGAFGFGLVGSITFLDNVGCIAIVEGRSMQPTLNPESAKTNDIVFLSKRAMKNFSIERGDVCSVISPSNPNEILIKRVIALEGDTVRTLTYKNQYVTIPKGHCWIEGDNSEHSRDSNHYGPISLGLICSRASRVLWPPSRFQTLQKTVPKNRIISDQRIVQHMNDPEATGIEEEIL